MSEPILNIRRRDRTQSLRKSLQQGVKSSSLCRPQGSLDFRPAQLNRVEVWRIGRQEFQACSLRFNQLANGLAGMSRQVIQHHDVASTQGREQLRAHISFKGAMIEGTFNHPRSGDSLPTHCGEQGVMRARITGRGFYDPLPGGGSTAQARQAQMCSTFIDKFQAFHQFAQTFHELCLKILPQGFYSRRLALAVVERLFLTGSFKICNSRHIMLGLTRKLWASWTRSHNSTSVTSGRFFTSARMSLSADCRVRLGPWAAGKAAQLPVSRQRYHHFSNVDLWIRNCAATSAWV